VVVLAALGAVNPEAVGKRSKIIDDLKIILFLYFVVATRKN
jgi:hypothetical protein